MFQNNTNFWKFPCFQATLAPPVKGKMLKGLCVCYAIVISTFFSVAISGYWAFGNNQAPGIVLQNFIVNDEPLLPRWVLLMTNAFTVLQVAAVSVVRLAHSLPCRKWKSICSMTKFDDFGLQVYLQPTNEAFEKKFVDAKIEQFAISNVVPRLFFRSLSVVIATTVAAMFPFFGDFNAVLGAFGFIPLDFVLPMVFYNVTFKPSKRTLIFWGNTSIAIIFSLVAVVGIISSIRQTILDANTYSFFANM